MSDAMLITVRECQGCLRQGNGRGSPQWVIAASRVGEDHQLLSGFCFQIGKTGSRALQRS